MIKRGLDLPAPPPGATGRHLAIAVGLPLLLVGSSYILWWISNRLGHIGPLDRAAFGWMVVIPVWISASVAAGFTWGRLTERVARSAAVLVGSAVGAVAALMMWRSVAFPACETGPIHQPSDWILPSLVLGIVVGAGMSGSGLLAAGRIRAGRPRQAVVFGAAASLLAVFAAILCLAVLFLGAHCQRPTT